jgi:hypothetical protein
MTAFVPAPIAAPANALVTVFPRFEACDAVVFVPVVPVVPPVPVPVEVIVFPPVVVPVVAVLAAPLPVDVNDLPVVASVVFDVNPGTLDVVPAAVFPAVVPAIVFPTVAPFAGVAPTKPFAVA